MQIENIFYSIGNFFAGTSKRAQKQFFNTRIPIQINSGRVQLVNTAVPYKIYTSIPQFRIPINRLAAMLANGIFKIQAQDGTLKDLPTGYSELLARPNVLQSQNSFMELYVKQLKVYGNQYIRKNQASKLGVPKSLICVSPAIMTPVLTGKLYDQVDIEGIIKYYEYAENGITRQFQTNEVLWSKIDDIDNPLIGCSPLIGLQFPVSNTELAYKYLNCISGEMGALGVLSPAAPNKDSMGVIPMTLEQRREIEAEWRNNYGVEEGQMKTKFSEVPLQFTHSTFPTGELLLLEQIDANFKTILDELGVNSNLFINSTYENMKHGLVSTHNDTVVPMADSFCQALGEFIGLPNLVLDYSHLSYLQPDKLSDAETFSSVSSALSSLVSGGIITTQEANARLINQFGKVS